MTTQEQFKVNDNIIRIPLSGGKLSQNVNDLNVINQYGSELYKTNKDFIRENVPDTWFGAIEPTTATFVASNHPLKLYEYTATEFPGKLIYVIGLLRSSTTNFIFDYA